MHKLVDNLSDFKLILFMDTYYDQNDFEGKYFNFDIYAHTFPIDPSSKISSIFILDLIHPDSRLIHYIMNHVLFLGKATISPSKNQTFLKFAFWKMKLRKLGIYHTSPRAG